MLQSRVIPCLLVKDRGLVKSTKFNDYRYIGDPINAVRIYNEKEVDELIVLDIDATIQSREPDYQLIEALALECKMPLCYGGGIQTKDQARKIISLGVEKIALSSAAAYNPPLIREISRELGSQSVVVVIDVKQSKLATKYAISVCNGKKAINKDVFQFAAECQELGAGEIVIQSIDRDGEMCGYDLNLISELRKAVTLPITALGGAGSRDDIAALISKFKIIGAAAGSLFVYKGKLKAVLINY
jgi:cyclase